MFRSLKIHFGIVLARGSGFTGLHRGFPTARGWPLSPSEMKVSVRAVMIWITVILSVMVGIVWIYQHPNQHNLPGGATSLDKHRDPTNSCPNSMVEAWLSNQTKPGFELDETLSRMRWRSRPTLDKMQSLQRCSDNDEAHSINRAILRSGAMMRCAIEWQVKSWQNSTGGQSWKIERFATWKTYAATPCSTPLWRLPLDLDPSHTHQNTRPHSCPCLQKKSFTV